MTHLKKTYFPEALAPHKEAVTAPRRPVHRLIPASDYSAQKPIFYLSFYTFFDILKYKIKTFTRSAF